MHFLHWYLSGTPEKNKTKQKKPKPHGFVLCLPCLSHYLKNVGYVQFFNYDNYAKTYADMAVFMPSPKKQTNKKERKKQQHRVVSGLFCVS